MTRLYLLTACAALLMLAGCNSGSAQSAHSDCDRSCLGDALDRYLEAVVAQRERDLADVLARANRAVGTRTALPVLQGLLCEVSGNTLRVTGTDLDAPMPLDGSLVFDDWIVAVTGADLDATERVTDFTVGNSGPEEGFEYVVFSLQFTYLGDDQAYPNSEFDFAVWADSERYDDYCGLIPDDLAQTMNDGGHLSAGGTLAADSCVQVPADLTASRLILEVHLDTPIRDEATGYLLISLGS
jgi:hypothetical protein